MDTSRLKDSINQELAGIEDEHFLKSVSAMIRAYVEGKEDDFADRLTPAQIASIERGLQQIKKGKTVPHEEVRKRYGKWL
jgi:predicted transcriptional regulator